MTKAKDANFDSHRDTGISIMLDANCINARQADAAVNRPEVLDQVHMHKTLTIVWCIILGGCVHAGSPEWCRDYKRRVEAYDTTTTPGSRALADRVRTKYVYYCAEGRAEASAERETPTHHDVALERHRQWEYQQAEAARQQALEQARRRQALKEQLTPVAAAHDLDLLFDSSLAGTLNNMIQKAIPTGAFARAAIVLGQPDESFKAIQVWGGGEALFTSPHCGAKVLLQKYPGDIYEGTALTALSLVVVRITGTKVYETATSGSAQAFTVEPAW